MTMRNNPAAVHTPKGFRRLKRGESLRSDDLYLHVIDFKWIPVGSHFTINDFTNCIRPIPLIPQYCSNNDFK